MCSSDLLQKKGWDLPGRRKEYQHRQSVRWVCFMKTAWMFPEDVPGVRGAEGKP